MPGDLIPGVELMPGEKMPKVSYDRVFLVRQRQIMPSPLSHGLVGCFRSSSPLAGNFQSRGELQLQLGA